MLGVSGAATVAAPVSTGGVNMAASSAATRAWASRYAASSARQAAISARSAASSVVSPRSNRSTASSGTRMSPGPPSRAAPMRTQGKANVPARMAA